MANSKTRSILATVLTRFVGKGANFVVLLILARALSVADLGVYGFVFVASIMISVAFDLGVRNSVAYFSGRDPERAADHALHALVLFVPLVLLSLLITPFVLDLGNVDLPTSAALIAVMLNIASLLFIRLAQGILLGNGNIATFNRTELVPRLAILAGTIGVFGLHSIDILTALYTLAISNLCGAIAVCVAVAPSVRGGSLRPWTDIKRILGRGSVFMMGAVSMLAVQKVAFLVLSWIGDDAEAGIFYGILRLTEFMTEIGLAVSVVIFSNSVRAQSKTDAIRDVAESTRICLAFFVILATIAYVLAPWLVPAALGRDFAGHEGLFRILLVGTVLGTVWTMIFPTLSTIEHPVVALVILVPNLTIGVVFTWVLYAADGVHGAAWAMVLTQALTTTSMLVAFKARHNAKIREFLLVSLDDVRGIPMLRRLTRDGSGARN